MTRGGSSERGSASVLALVMATVLVTAALVAGMLGGLLAGQRRAAAAADLAALAAAQSVQAPAGSDLAGDGACAQARRIGAANRARLTGCVVEGPEVSVAVVVEVPVLLGLEVGVPGRARAGPAAGPVVTGPGGRFP